MEFKDLSPRQQSEMLKEFDRVQAEGGATDSAFEYSAKEVRKGKKVITTITTQVSSTGKVTNDKVDPKFAGKYTQIVEENVKKGLFRGMFGPKTGK